MDTALPSARFPAPAGPKRIVPLPVLAPQGLLATPASTVESTKPPAGAPALTGPKLEVSVPHPGQQNSPMTQAPPQAAGAMVDRVKSFFDKREKETALIPVKLEQQEPADEQPPFPPTPGNRV